MFLSNFLSNPHLELIDVPYPTLTITPSTRLLSFNFSKSISPCQDEISIILLTDDLTKCPSLKSK